MGWKGGASLHASGNGRGRGMSSLSDAETKAKLTERMTSEGAVMVAEGRCRTSQTDAETKAKLTVGKKWL